MQYRYFNFDDDDSTYALNNADKGVRGAGLYRGFNYDASSAGTTLVLSHTANTTSYVDQTTLAITQRGMYITNQGTRIYEDANISIPLTSNAANANPRIDLIIATHQYIGISGGAAATYTQVVGTPSASPAQPTLSSPATQVIIGVIYWPASTAGVQNANYTRSKAPFFSGVAVVRTNDDENIYASKKFFGNLLLSGGTGTYDNTTGIVKLDGAGNYYEVAIPATGIINLNGITSFASRWDGTNTRTKAGAVIHIQFTTNGVAAEDYLNIAGSVLQADALSSPLVSKHDGVVVSKNSMLTFIEQPGGGSPNGATYRLSTVEPRTRLIKQIPSFGSGWTPATAFQTPVVYREPNGLIYMQGSINAGASPNASPFTLPPGFYDVQRASNHLLPTLNGGTPGFVLAQISTGGVVSFTGTYANYTVFLDALRFQIFYTGG